MLDARTVNRYFFLPILGWSISLVWLTLKSPHKLMRYCGAVLLACMLLVGIPGSLQFPKFNNYYFPQQVSEFEKLPPGQTYVFKTVPGWTMTLTKK